LAFQPFDFKHTLYLMKGNPDMRRPH